MTEAHGSWDDDPNGYAYQWEDCTIGQDFPGFLNCVAIPGATSQTYVPRAGDVGYNIAVEEWATNAWGDARHRQSLVVLARAHAALHAVDPAPLKLELTARGRALVRQSGRLRITGTAVFTPVAGRPIRVQRTFLLARR